MNETVKKDILTILSETEEALRNVDFKHLSEISNHTIHNASIFQDEDSISAAVIVHSLAKLGRMGQDIPSSVQKDLNSARESLDKGNLGAYNRAVKSIIRAIKNVSGGINKYIQEVITEAEIKKGSKIYDQGISLARAAQLLNINQWELMSYIGKTKIHERELGKDSKIMKRIRYTKEIFGIR